MSLPRHHHQHRRLLRHHHRARWSTTSPSLLFVIAYSMAAACGGSIVTMRSMRLVVAAVGGGGAAPRGRITGARTDPPPAQPLSLSHSRRATNIGGCGYGGGVGVGGGGGASFVGAVAPPPPRHHRRRLLATTAAEQLHRSTTTTTTTADDARRNGVECLPEAMSAYGDSAIMAPRDDDDDDGDDDDSDDAEKYPETTMMSSTEGRPRGEPALSLLPPPIEGSAAGGRPHLHRHNDEPPEAHTAAQRGIGERRRPQDEEAQAVGVRRRRGDIRKQGRRDEVRVALAGTSYVAGFSWAKAVVCSLGRVVFFPSIYYGTHHRASSSSHFIINIRV